MLRICASVVTGDIGVSFSLLVTSLCGFVIRRQGVRALQRGHIWTETWDTRQGREGGGRGSILGRGDSQCQGMAGLCSACLRKSSSGQLG